MITYSDLQALLKLSSKQQMVDLCQQSFLYRKCSPQHLPDALVEKYLTLLSISAKETRQCISTLGNLIKTALFQGSSEPQDIIALFPSNFHKSLRDLITRIILDNMAAWKADAVSGQVTDIKMKMKYLNDQYTRARRKVLTTPETANLSRRDEHLLRRLSFLQESKASSCPGFVTEVKDDEDTEGQEGTIVISSVTLDDPSVIDNDDTASEASESMQDAKNDPDFSPGGHVHHQAASETDDIKDVIINLHQTTATVASVSSTSSSSKPSPLLLTAVGANKTIRSSPALLTASSNNPPPALPTSTIFKGEPKAKKRKFSEKHEAAHSMVSLPKLTDFDWRVDTKTSSDSIARMAVPTCILNLQIQERPDHVSQTPNTSNVNVELSKETLETMLDGLGKIRDQLASVANR